MLRGRDARAATSSRYRTAELLCPECGALDASTLRFGPEGRAWLDTLLRRRMAEVAGLAHAAGGGRRLLRAGARVRDVPRSRPAAGARLLRGDASARPESTVRESRRALTASLYWCDLARASAHGDVRNLPRRGFDAGHDLPRHHSGALALLGRSGLRRAAALRQRGRCGHVPPRHDAALARSRHVAHRLRAAFSATDRRALRREPQPPAALLPVPGDSQAEPGQRARPVLRLAARHRHRARRARHPPRRRRLGVADARRMGPGLGSLAQRHGVHAVHLLPAGRRLRVPPGARRDHLRPRAPRDVHPGRRQRLRPRLVGRSRRPHVHLRRRVPAKRAAVLGVQLRGRRRRHAARPLHHLRGRVQAHARRRATCCRPTTTCSSALTRSTCSTHAAPSASPSARATSCACARSRRRAARRTWSSSRPPRRATPTEDAGAPEGGDA